MSQASWIGIDLGGTKILAGLFDDAMQLKARVKQNTPVSEGPSGIFAAIAQAVESVRQMAGPHHSDIRGLGIGLPGQIDARAKRVKFAPNLGWRNLDLAPFLPSDWSWPVYPGNDVQLGTYGEFAHGAARGARHVVGIFVGTGVGGGLIIDGRLYGGFNYSAGEIGHTIVHWRKGTELEEIAGRRSIMRRAAELLADVPKKVRKDWKHLDPAQVRSSQLAELYHRNDPIALQLIDDAARALGASIASTINLLSPEVIVLGGGVTGALGESFAERIWEVTQRYTLPNATDGMRFVTASLGDDSGIVGAAAFARSHAVPAGQAV